MHTSKKYAVLMRVLERMVPMSKCPVCGDFGVLMKKTTITQTAKRKYRYEKWYVYHNRSKGTTQRWCYLSKKYLRLPEINKAMLREKATQNTIQTTQKSNNPNLGSISEIKVHYLPSLNGIVASDK